MNRTYRVIIPMFGRDVNAAVSTLSADLPKAKVIVPKLVNASYGPSEGAVEAIVELATYGRTDISRSLEKILRVILSRTGMWSAHVQAELIDFKGGNTFGGKGYRGKPKPSCDVSAADPEAENPASDDR